MDFSDDLLENTGKIASLIKRFKEIAFKRINGSLEEGFY